MISSEVKFLKIPTPEAIVVLEKCMESGYVTLDKIRNDYKSRRETSTNPTSSWEEWCQSWVNDTLIELSNTFVSSHRLYDFREARTTRYATIGDLPYTWYENDILAKISVLKENYTFIMSRASITIHNNGNINFQSGSNNINEQH